MSVLIGKECPYLAVAQAGLVKAHVRADVGGIEIKPATKFVLAPFGVSAQFITVHVSEILAVDAIHLRYVLDGQSCRLNLRLLKKPRTRR